MGQLPMVLKNAFNMKVILIAGIVIIAAAVIGAALIFTSNSGDSGIGNATHGERLSGKYVSDHTIPAIGGNYPVDESIYIEFSGANKFALYGITKIGGSPHLNYQGTYTVEGTVLTLEWTEGNYNRSTSHISINNARDTITIGGGMSSSGLVAFDGIVFVKK